MPEPTASHGPKLGADAPAPSPDRLASILRPLQAFVRLEATAGILLLICTFVAMAWANSSAAGSYFRLWETTLTIGTDRFGLSKSVIHWINDGLMTIFFLLIGLEIKREVLFGELSNAKGAALPLAAALGGMVLPASIYAVIAIGFGSPESRRGWGVPMATDIAFALGVLALLGRRAPSGLRVFLAALAIADDLAAVLVIAIFYTARLSLGALAFASGCVAVLALGNRLGIRRTAFYTLLGIVLWVAVLKSGVHATIAGVLLATTIPARRRIDRSAFVARARTLVEEFAAGDGRAAESDLTAREMEVVRSLEHACEGVNQPLHRFEKALYPWVGLVVMPLFALANAGVSVDIPTARGAAGDAASIGIFLGLLVGKQFGVFGFAWLTVRMGLARLPASATWSQLYGVAWLCGIGFTMSLFIAALAFTSPQVLDHAKLAILSASTLAALVGTILLIATGRRTGAASRSR